jgi:hypothetical protein
MVSILEQEQQDRIKEALARIEAVMEEFGDDGLVAVTIVCAEAAAKINAR